MKAKYGRKPKKESLTPLLQKWQRNNLFEAIQAVGLDPRDFDLADSGTEVQIKHKRSGSIFIIGGGPGHYVGRYIVGDSPTWPYDAYSWQASTTRVGTWLQEVKRDLENPDLWAELRREAVDGIEDSVAIRNSQRASGAKVTLQVDDQKDVLGRDLQFSIPCDGHLSSKIGCGNLPPGAVADG